MTTSHDEGPGRYVCPECGDEYNWNPGDTCADCGAALIIVGAPAEIVTREEPTYCATCGERTREGEPCRACARRARARDTVIDVDAMPKRGELAARDHDKATIELENWQGRVPGVYTTITNEHYHRHAALSKTRLDWLDDSVEHYLHNMRNPPEPTPPMVLGTMIHEAVLEPERFRRWRPWNGRRYGRDYDRFVMEVENEARDTGLPLAECSQKFYDTARRCRDRALAHPVAGELLEGPGMREVSALVDLEEYPMPPADDGRHHCLQGRTRPDLWIADHRGPAIVDLKSTKSAKASRFERDCANYRYHVSAAWYSDIWERATGVRAEMFVFIAVETYAPFPVAVYILEPAAVELGRSVYQDDVRKLYETVTAPEGQRFAGYNGGDVRYIDVPRWEYTKRGK